MNNNGKGRDIFFGVVAVATLIVAIIGATLAYFSITASSNEGALNATAKVVSIDYYDGQQVTAQANELIPAKFEEVVKRVYETVFVDNADNPDAADPANNLCVDSNGEQVCSVYRFSISSTGGITITASLKNEYNGFDDLKYAIYERGEDGEPGNWMKLNDANPEAGEDDSFYNYYNSLNKCMNDVEDVLPCTGLVENTTLIDYKDVAVHSLFGTIKNVKQSVEVLGTKTFDLVLFLYDNGKNQNAQQGQQYNGTITVDVASTSGENISGTIYDDELESRFDN